VLELLRAEKVIGPKDGWDKVMFGSPKKGEKGAPNEDGYKGRVGIHEVLKMSPSVKELVMKGATSAAIEAQAKKEGMVTMLEDGIFIAAQGLTTIEEVLRVVTE
jgi:type IV pilus assembly protein PilB